MSVMSEGSIFEISSIFITIVYSFIWLKFPGTPRTHISARSFLITTVLLDDFYLSILCDTQSITYQFVLLTFLTE